MTKKLLTYATVIIIIAFSTIFTVAFASEATVLNNSESTTSDDLTNVSSETETVADKCIVYTPGIVSDTFRYLDEIYIEKHPALGLRFLYGTPSDKQILENLAEMITEGCTTDREKANAIESWIQRNIEYKGGSAYPIDTFYNRFGDCMSYAQLMVALLRLEGIPATWGDGWRGDMELLTPDYMFNLNGHAWCYAYLDGEWVLYDPLWFNGGTTDKEYIAKWYYIDLTEGITPIYEEANSFRLNPSKNYYKDGIFFANTNIIVNNLFLLTTAFTDHDGYSYVNPNKDENNMISGEAYRDGWLWSGSKVYIYENGIHAAGTIIEEDSKLYYCANQSSHAFEVMCDSKDYSIIGGYFSVPVGINKKILASTSARLDNSGTESFSVVWESNDPSIASIDNNGVITTLKEGYAIISAHFYRDSDSAYMGSGCSYQLYVCDNERIPDYSDSYTNHEHTYIAITKDEYIIYTCTVEGCADGHIGYTLVNDHIYSCVEIDGTCIDLGCKTYTCTCGHQYVESFGELQDHIWCDWIEDNTSSGFPERSCTYCGLIEYQGVIAHGQCGDNATWFLSEEGCLIIRGSGDMTDYYLSGAPWIDYSNNIINVIIEDGITSIGGYSFAWCENLKQVTIPDSLTIIGEWAFHACHSLSKLTIPDSVTTIGTQAFSLCTTLSEINIPNSMNELGEGLFMDCRNLEKIDIPQNITNIGAFVFSGCNKLNEISLPVDVTHIGRAAFQNCSSLKEISIPQKVNTIEEWAFANCTSLETIELSNNITILDDNLFSNCTSLKTFHIPDSVIEIRGSLFPRCTNLKEVTISDDHAYFTIIDGVIFTKNMLTLIEYLPYLTDESYTIPSGVLVLGHSAFSDHFYLKTIYIPESVVHFNADIFNDCTTLEKIYFKGDAPYFSSNRWLDNVTATIYYPTNNDTWTTQIMGNYFGTITWIPYDICELGHSYEELVIKPSFGGIGYTLYTCSVCGNSYKDNYTDALTYLPGDIEGDGDVDKADAEALLKYLTGWDIEIVKDALDTNADGKVNIRDAATILLYLEGKIDSLN